MFSWIKKSCYDHDFSVQVMSPYHVLFTYSFHCSRLKYFSFTSVTSSCQGKFSYLHSLTQLYHVTCFVNGVLVDPMWVQFWIDIALWSLAFWTLWIYFFFLHVLSQIEYTPNYFSHLWFQIITVAMASHQQSHLTYMASLRNSIRHNEQSHCRSCYIPSLCDIILPCIWSVD